MNLHPLIVHFPIALLTLYSMLELFSWLPFLKKKDLLLTKCILLIVGIVGAFFAIKTGERAAGDFIGGSLEKILDAHALFAVRSLRVYAVITFVYILFWRQKYESQDKLPIWVENMLFHIQQWHVLKVFALLGFTCLAITGALGGGMVYGPDVEPLTRVLFDIILK